MKQEPIELLQDFARQLKEKPRTIQPWVVDPRGNAMSIKSVGHRHHPFWMNRVVMKWAALLEKKLKSPAMKWCGLVEKLYGLRPLGTQAPTVGVEVWQYRYLVKKNL